MPYSDLQFEAMANVRPGPAARGNHALQSAVAATVSRSQNVVVIYWFIPLLLLAGILALLVLLGRSRRDADRIEEENQKFAQDRQRLFEFIHLMTEALGEGLTREELHQRIVHASILCTGALSACIFEQTDRGTLRGIAVEGLFPPHRPLTDALKSTLGTRAKFIEQVLKSEEFAVGEGIVGRVASSRRGEWLADAAADPRMVKHDDAALAVRSAIVVPLIFREKFFGVLAVANPVGESQFNEADFVLLQSLAEQAALALHNAEFLHLQMEKQQLDLDLSIASGIQQMLLPRGSPEIGGLALDARYAPAQRVGGDFYDFFPLSATKLGIVVADVSGKGMPAALLMAICRTNLQHIAPRHPTPSQALIALNAALSADIQPGLFVTMLYAIVEVATNRLTLARAGHELPLILRSVAAPGEPPAEFLASEGMALGLVPTEIFSGEIVDVAVPFGPGDVLVLYTDGVTEAANEEGKEFSGARLADAGRALKAGSPGEINDGILASLRRFTGELPPRDDLTLLTVKRT